MLSDTKSCETNLTSVSIVRLQPYLTQLSIFLSQSPTHECPLSTVGVEPRRPSPSESHSIQTFSNSATDRKITSFYPNPDLMQSCFSKAQPEVFQRFRTCDTLTE